MKLQRVQTKPLKVCDFNELLSCQLCHGYLINPTTVDHCLHTYCRSCIVQHLQSDIYCPQCKIAGGDKQINVTNLKSDDVLRVIIFKLIPGLYQKEREQTIQFKTTLRNGQQRKEDNSDEEQQDVIIEENFFAPTEPISLSLEYHPVLLRGCSTSQIPPVRYLQCPAGLKIHHLKRFLCSKFDIDPESKRIEVEVIYEDEVLPNDFTLMDVGYCYNWKRHAPMKFTYRILFYGDESQKQGTDYNKREIEIRACETTNAVMTSKSQQNEEMSICDETSITTLTTTTTCLPNNNSRNQLELQKAVKSKTKLSKGIKSSSAKVAEESIAPVKVIIARKSSADSGKKLSPKHNNNNNNNADDVTYTVSNDFKSLRSNDMRYSDYAVSSTTSNSNSPKGSPKSAQRSPKSGDVAIRMQSPISPALQSASAVVSKCDILVSIPQSQMPKSPYSVDDEFENVSLAQLKTASKKSPPFATTTTTTATTVMESPKNTSHKNVPKLKIELNSLKTRLNISKPKSAGVIQSADVTEKRERTKQRKHSLDEVAAPLTDHLDLETYAKNIGLQPIEVLTPPESAESSGDKLKYSPNASPLSSASSTTSSSNSAFPLSGASNELTTTTGTFHKKRKKKHSKDSKDPKESKRRRMHAEISSKPEEESLKMKVKLTPSHNHKSHRSQTDGRDKTSMAKDKTTDPSQQAVTDSLLALNKTLGEESRSINHLMRENEKAAKESIEVVKADDTLLILPQCNSLPKSLNNIKDTKLPASPPLPPSLFKTTPLNFKTLAVTSTTTGQSKSNTTNGKTELPKPRHILPLPTTTKQSTSSVSLALKSHPNFIVPSLPRRPSPGSNSSYTPSSIASSSNKQLGLQLKRSASLDESYALAGGRGKQPKLDNSTQRKPIYSSYVNKPFPVSINNNGFNKTTDTIIQNIQNSGGSSSSSSTVIPVTPRSSGASAVQVQTQWQLPSYTALQLPFNKSAVEVVRINSSQTAIDIKLQPTINNTSKAGRMMGPPLSMVKGKKSNSQSSNTSIISGKAKSPPIPINATSLGQARSNTYRLSPPALVNLQGSNFTTMKKANTLASDNVLKKEDTKRNITALEKQLLQQQRNSLRDFRPMRDQTIVDIIDVTGGNSSDKDEIRLADTTVSAQTITTAHTAKEGLEAALNKIKQSITTTTVPENTSTTGVTKQKQQQPTSKDMNTEDLQNLHLLSESATAREKITIRTSQSYEKPKMQQSTLVRQQNASVRNIPNPSALAFRNMSTLPAVVSSTPTTIKNLNSITTTTTNTTSSTNTTTSIATTNIQTQQMKTLLPLTTSSAAAHNSGNLLHSTITTTTSSSSSGNNSNINSNTNMNASSSPSNIATSSTTTTTTTTRNIKKPTTIDQVAANLNMRASAAAAEANAAKLSAAEDMTTQISSSTNLATTTAAEKNKNELLKTEKSKSPNMASSSTTTAPNITSVVIIDSETETDRTDEMTEVKKVLKMNGGGKMDEKEKSKVLPKSSIDVVSGVTTTIVTDVVVVKNTTNNNNTNANNNNNNNNNNSNSKNNNNNNNNNSNSNSQSNSNNNNNNNGNSKLGVTSASVASD